MSRISEKHLDELREAARRTGQVTRPGFASLDHAAAKMGEAQDPSRLKAGYYGMGLLKPPVWTWEVPVYFFIGGMAGMAPVIGLAAWTIKGNIVLARAALWLAAGGAIVSPVLLAMDLGKPSRFLNMLRVFKWRSAMSMGAWILTAFGACAVPGAVLIEIHFRLMTTAQSHFALGLAGFLFLCGAAFWGSWLATYTGVLLGATAIPVWFTNRWMLPFHFGIAAFGSAAAVLEAAGFDATALRMIGIAAASAETLIGIWIELGWNGAADAALREGRSGWLMRAAAVCAGPASLGLRIAKLDLAALSLFLLGILLNRFGWVRAGHACALQPEAVLGRAKQPRLP